MTQGYRTVNPANGEVVLEFDFIDDSRLQEKLELAFAAYQRWRDVPLADRVKVALAAARLFEERADELASLATLEMGKRFSKGRGEAAFCGQILRYYAEEGPGLLADEPLKTTSDAGAVLQRRPIGPLLGIMPWNYPYYQVVRFVAPNLVLGNTMLVKHAEVVPQCALAIESLLRDAGAPEGIYQSLFASHDQIETVIADDRVQGVSLTGSERAGAAIGALAGRHLKKCVLELGGSDPYIVLDARDVDAAAAAAWKRRINNMGQTCNSNKRMIVSSAIYNRFVESLVEEARSLVPGDPAAEAAGTFAPLSSRAAAEGLAAQVADAVAKGATLHAGGTISDGADAYFAPAVLTDVKPGMRAYSEELFGPVAVVYKVETDEDAVTLANDTPYGLGAAVFSADPDRAAAVAERLEAGMVSVNSAAGEGAELPFGGVKRSGFGRELGPLGMDEFANKRLAYVAR